MYKLNINLKLSMNLNLGFGEVSDEILESSFKIVDQVGKSLYQENTLKLDFEVMVKDQKLCGTIQNILQKFDPKKNEIDGETNFKFSASFTKDDFFKMFDNFLIEQPNSTGHNNVSFDVQVPNSMFIEFVQNIQTKMAENEEKGKKEKGEECITETTVFKKGDDVSALSFYSGPSDGFYRDK